MKKLIALTIFLSFLSSLAVAGLPYNSTLTNEELVARIGQMRQTRLAGHFTRISPEVLKFEGYLDKDSYDKYRQQIDGRVKVLVIDSPGGDTNSGVKIGLDIRKRKLTVVVEGAAASSAANYLFLAGDRKIIAKGFVSFHGNARALLAQAGGYDKLKNELQAKYKLSDKDFAAFRKELEETIKLENEFYSKLNISQKLFDTTQEPGKGLKLGQDDGFSFLLPSVKTMELYGVKNVSGRQDIDLAEKLGLKVIYY